jgi:hypothetical protein
VTPWGGAAVAAVKECWEADEGSEDAAAADGFQVATRSPCTEAAGAAAAALATPCSEPPCAADGRRAFKTLRSGAAAAPLPPSLLPAPALAPPSFVGFVPHLAALTSSDIPRTMEAGQG